LKRFSVLLAVLVAVSLPAAAFGDPPATTITGGPNGNSYKTSPEFSFTSSAAPATFECSLDGAPFSSCQSPLKLGPLAMGDHTFSVRSINTGGEVDPAPPVRSWKVVPPLTAPVVKLLQPARRTLRIAAFRRISGSAVAPSGVTRIQVTLQRGGPDKSVFPPRCTYFDMRTATKTLQPCILPAYFPAPGTTKWHYSVTKTGRAVLTPGKYTLIVRAFNPYGQASQTRFPLTLR
jgi:hypothetical protein